MTVRSRYIIVKMLFGSHLYGTNTEQSDHDYKGVFIPEWEDIVLQRVPHSIHTSTKKGSESKNSPDDVENEVYSIHYFLHLACEGETVALDMLHAPAHMWITSTDIWMQLVTKRHLFYTKNLKAFVGYARKQAAKYGVKGSRLTEAKRVLAFLKQEDPRLRLADVWDRLPRGEHIHFSENETGPLYEVCGKMLSARAYVSHYIPMLEAFVLRYGERAKQAERNEGVDWKAVSHAFRAAYQVKHILVDGGYTYPLPETDWIMKVKCGGLHYANEVGPALDALMDELEGLSRVSKLPAEVDRTYWDDWLVNLINREVVL